jgi:hypothetical protein
LVLDIDQENIRTRNSRKVGNKVDLEMKPTQPWLKMRPPFYPPPQFQHMETEGQETLMHGFRKRCVES